MLRPLGSSSREQLARLRTLSRAGMAIVARAGDVELVLLPQAGASCDGASDASTDDDAELWVPAVLRSSSFDEAIAGAAQPPAAPS